MPSVFPVIEGYFLKKCKRKICCFKLFGKEKEKFKRKHLNFSIMCDRYTKDEPPTCRSGFDQQQN